MTKKYQVLSPDGFTIGHEEYSSEYNARIALSQWIVRYQAQGYYSTSSRERIPLLEIASHCRIVKA